MSPYRRLKPHKNEKTERNWELYRYHLEHPEGTYRELGTKFGISGQRAHKLAKRMRKYIENPIKTY